MRVFSSNNCKFWILAALILPWSAHAGDLEDGLAAALAKDYVKAEQYWMRGAQAQSAASMYNLAGLHLSGLLGVPNHRKAVDLLTQASALGHAGADVSLGYLYQNGVGVTADSGKAGEFFRKAARAGHVEGKFRYAELQLRSSSEPEAVKQALVDVQEAGQAGFPPALHAIGQMFRQGRFAPHNPARALEFFKSGSGAGHAESALALGEMYLNGEAGALDHKEAMRWLRRAADLSNPDAHYLLGYLLAHQAAASAADLQEAARHFSAAAEAWHEKAQAELGRMLLSGSGTPRDLVAAYKWLELSASTGYAEAHYLRSLAGKDMSPADIESARGQARAWFEKNHSIPHRHSNNAIAHSLR